MPHNNKTVYKNGDNSIIWNTKCNIKYNAKTEKHLELKMKLHCKKCDICSVSKLNHCSANFHYVIGTKIIKME